MQLVSTNIGGNLHAASNTVNNMGLAKYVLCMNFSGSSTVVVFKVPNNMAEELRRHLGVLDEYVKNPQPELQWAGCED